ncbi:sugar diacid recognition domain-containing protein [Propionivibrio soli]|uniref:sugar diacid recognition domain-containing protein n=1 Tax=Propionivibrio soli TaxID=2976531 RepID=UPI0021E7150E|nr:sugar diacid recognition domain-containing protein [Propionivibrio soli]
MVSIDSKLAQEIVERTMKIIPFNVNVMDARGMIVGSGEGARIGEVHAGAQLALARGETVEIELPDSRNMPGSRPGVNLPMTVRGALCGVVGLTGDPRVVRQFGELVRITAEMILEQAQLLGELQREKRYREEFVFHLVNQENTSRADLEAWALRLDIDFDVPRAVLVLNLTEEELPTDQALKELQRCQTQLAIRQPEALTAVISPREMAILKVFDDRALRKPRQIMAREELAALAAALERESGRLCSLAMGVALPGIEGVPLSYQSACKTYRVGRQRCPEKRLFSFYDLSLPVLLASLGSGWQGEQLRRPLQGLNAADKRGAMLRRTLDVWFAQNGHAAAAANALHIHRNTLDYRLNQIEEATGLDLGNTDDRLLLYVALQLD